MASGWFVLSVVLGSAAFAADDDSEVTHLTDDSTDRKPLQTMVPQYPEKARRQRLTKTLEEITDELKRRLEDENELDRGAPALRHRPCRAPGR